MLVLLVLCLFATGSLSSETQCGACVDLTRVPEAYGTDVVLACVRLIQQSGIFPDDSGLLRRIAFVETQDGDSAFTYVKEFYGGIWGVKREPYEETKSAPQEILNSIQTYFQIDWKNTAWEDLRKPLYSAIATRVYLHMKAGGSSLKSSEHLSFWKMLNGTRRKESDFQDAVSVINDTSIDIENVDIGRHIEQQIDGVLYFETSHNHDLVEIDFSVTLGNATLFVSNLISPSEAVHCGMTNGGRLVLNPMEMISYGSSEKLYISIDGTEGAIVQLAIVPARVGGSVNFESESDEFIFGMFSNHPDAGSPPITLIITTSEADPVDFTIESVNGTIQNCTVNPNKPTEVMLPETYVVSNVNEIGKGLSLKTESGKKVSVSVGSHFTYSSDSYLALPLIEYVGLEVYTYYAITPNTNTSGLNNRVLLVGGFDHTSVTIITTREAKIKDANLEPNIPHTVELSRLETLMIESEFPLTGTKVVANKPITFLSGHQCAVIPQTGNSCDFAIEQLPPTITWGEKFVFSMLSSRTGGSHFTILTSENDTDVFLWCSLPSTNQSLEHNFTLSAAGSYKALEIAPDDVVCSLITTKPSLLVVLGTSENADENNGDPLLIMLPPVEQYSTKVKFRMNENFNNTYVNLVVMGDRSDVLVDSAALSYNQWNEVQAPYLGTDTFGFVTQLPINDSMVHSLTTINDNTNFSAVVYGFAFSVGYGQRAGMRLSPIANTFTSTNQPQLSVSIEGKQLTCFTGGIPAYAFTWEKIGSGVINAPSCKYSISSSGYDRSVLTINGGSSEDSGEYKCTFYSYYQESVSVSQLLADPPQPPQTKEPSISLNKMEFGNTEGGNVVINVNSGELGDQTISWRYENPQGIVTDISNDPGKYVLSANRLSLTVKNLKIGEHGYINIAVRNNGGTALLKVSLVVYVEADIIMNEPAEYELKSGDKITFNCSADGIHRPNIAWRKDGKLILNNTKYEIQHEVIKTGFRTIEGVEGISSSLKVLNLVEEDAGQYSCRADNEAESPSTKSFTLQVSPRPTEPPTDYCEGNPCKKGNCKNLATTYQCICTEEYTGKNCDQFVHIFIEPQIVKPPRDTRAKLYERVQLECDAVGNPTPVVEWYKDGKRFPNTDSDTSDLVIMSIAVDDRGIYHCQAWNTKRNGDIVRKTSTNIILNIEGVVQYEAYLNITHGTNQNIANLVEEINEYLSGRSPTTGTSFFFVEYQNETTDRAGNTVYPILVTLVTESGGSSELLNTVKQEMAMVSMVTSITITFDVDSVDRFDGCPANSTIVNDNPYFTIIWPETDIGQTATVECPCGTVSSANNLTATRYCGGDFVSGGKWREENVASCMFSDLVQRLCELSMLDVPKKIQQLDSLTDNTTALRSTEVIVSVSILTDSTDDIAGNETLTQSFLNVVDNILNVNETILQTSVEVSNTSARLQEAILAVADSLPFSNNSDSAIFTQSTFAVSVQRINFSSFDGLSFGTTVNLSQIFSQEKINRDNIFYDDEYVESSTAAITLPRDLFNNPNSFMTNNSRISNSVFLTDGAFLTRIRQERRVGSLIVSARVVGNARTAFKNLADPVKLRFQRNQDLTNATDPQCVFFDTSADDGFGNWSNYGCNISIVGEDGLVLCECDHLTSFSILFDVSPMVEPTEPSHAGFALNAITYIGLCVSIVCLMITVVSYLSSKKLRNSEAGLLLINMCIALTGLYLSFIAAIHSIHIEGVCAFVAAVLQYFFLVTFMSMAAEAVNLYFKLVIIIGKKIERFVIKSIIIVWVAPFFVVVFTFVPNYKNYVSDHFCRAFGTPYYVGMIVPFLIIYLFNWTVFIITIGTLLKAGYRKKSFHGGIDPSTSRFVRQQLISAITLSTLLGIGWGIGLFATQSIHKSDISRDVIAAVFVLVTAFHGFFVLIMHCLRSDDVRRLWKRWFYGVTRQDTTEVTTSVLYDQPFKKKGKPKGFQNNKLNTGISSGNTFSSEVQTAENESYGVGVGGDSTLRYQVAMQQKRNDDDTHTYADMQVSTFSKSGIYDEPSFKEDNSYEKPPLLPE